MGTCKVQGVDTRPSAFWPAFPV